jgi:cell division protein FtsA
MEGAVELAEEVFHMPVRLGVPQYVEGLADVVRNPIHATGVGLLLYGKEAIQARVHGSSAKAGFSGVFERMRSWFQGNF